MTRSEREYQRERRSYLQARGLCVVCKAPAVGSYCVRCSEKRNARKRALLARRAVEGRCQECGDPSRGALYCDRCRERHNAGQRAALRRRVEAGVCVRCGAEAAPNRTRCFRCLEIDAARPRRSAPEERRAADQARRTRLREEGLCIGCGAVPALPGKVRCEDCLQKARDWRNLRRATRRNDQGEDTGHGSLNELVKRSFMIHPLFQQFRLRPEMMSVEVYPDGGFLDLHLSNFAGLNTDSLNNRAFSELRRAGSLVLPNGGYVTSGGPHGVVVRFIYRLKESP